MVSSLALSLGCPDREDPVQLEPTPVGTTQEARKNVSLDSIRNAMPEWSNGHVAWHIEWEGSRPARLQVERFVEGECYAQGRYVYQGGGELEKEDVLIRGSTEGEGVAEDELILSKLVKETSDEDLSWARRSDVAGRLIWSYKKVEPEDEGEASVELMGRVDYMSEPCVLSPVIRYRDVPAKQTPGNGSP